MANAPLVLSRRNARGERLVEAGLFLAAALGVLTTIGIVVVLTIETVQFFQLVSPLEYLTGTVWSASIMPFRFGDQRGRLGSRSYAIPCG